MYCSSCGTELPDNFRFCSQCGTSIQASQPKPVAGPLRRSREDKKVAGVCAGLARYLSLDVTLVRIVMLCISIWGIGLVFYIACWIIMPLDAIMLPPPSSQPVTNSPVLS